MPGRYRFDFEGFDFGIEQAEEVHFRSEVQEDSAKADGGPIHEDEFTRNRHRAFFLQRLMDARGFLSAVLAGGNLKPQVS